MGVKVISPGLFTTVQDGGRTGYQNLGFSTSGVMDRKSFQLANMLVENSPEEAVLELTVTGPILEFRKNIIIAITGGDFQPAVNGNAVPCCTALRVRWGDTLSFGGAKSGSRAYIAFAGGLDVPQVMGSRSTHTKCAIGGFAGRPLKAGDYLPFLAPLDHLPHLGSRRLPEQVFTASTAPLRVIAGPQEDYFTEKGIFCFYNSVYTVSNEFDRMGVRFTGPAVEHAKGADIISDGIPFGAIQIPSHGNPIVMLADRQTTGGYPKIGTVASVDLPKLVQCRPGEQVSFVKIPVEEAQQLLLEEAAEWERLREQIHKPHKRTAAYTVELL